MSIERIGIVGAGAWGTALAMVAHRAGCQVTLWAHEAEVVEAINGDHANPIFLPGVTLQDGIEATEDLTALAVASDAVLLVTPAQFLRATAERLATDLAPGVPLVICSKGIEQGTSAVMSEVVAETLPGRPMAMLAGPTFAAEVARGLPTAVTLACTDKVAGDALVSALGETHFRPYLSDDVIGAEIGGAVKNVLAIACGIAHGRAFGDNARAALITRGLAEMTRLAVAKGARPETMMGLAGLGDLTLTCTSRQSRNYSLGEALGKGEQLADIMASRRTVAEGVFSAEAVVALGKRLGVEMPIAEAVDSVLNRGETVDAAIAGLLTRPFRTESTG
ncbi:MAG: NAD(P)H-dependent glycerol-3-phosphate dehydrogenase [Alphaproteobacteria bacterium]